MHDPARQLAPDVGDPASTGRLAPQSPVEHATPRLSSRPRRLPWVTPFRVAVVLIVAAGVILTVVITGGSGPIYRTAVVGTGTAVATLDSVAAVTPVNKADLRFDVSGTVGAVDVAVGQKVSAGQVLASLDTTELDSGVVSAQASLASAQLTLAKDQASQTAGSSSTSSPTTKATASGTPAASSSSASPSGGHGASDQQIQNLQATLLADQRQQDEDAAAAEAALRTATTACQSSTSAASAAAATPSFHPPPTSPPTSSPPGSGGSGTALTCSAALAQASAAQSRLSTDIKTVDKDESALNAALESSSGSGGTAASGSGGANGGHGGSSSTTGATATTGAAVTAATTATSDASESPSGAASNGAGSDGSKAKPATAGQLAVDQASIDAAQANLDSAQAALGDANLVSTIAGTVASVSVAPGGSVSSASGSTSPDIVVIGSGNSYQAVADVPVTRIGAVSVGQRAVVTPDSTDAAVDGTVTAIGVLGTSQSTTTTYPVTVSLDSPDLGQLSGAGAEVSIVTQTSRDDAVTVPSSAVRTVGSRHLVTVLGSDGTTKSVAVAVGTVGDVLTEVTSGLTKGEKVVLADYGAPVPSSSATTGRFGLGGGGLGGGTFGGAGGLGRAGRSATVSSG